MQFNNQSFAFNDELDSLLPYCAEMQHIAIEDNWTSELQWLNNNATESISQVILSISQPLPTFSFIPELPEQPEYTAYSHESIQHSFSQSIQFSESPLPLTPPMRKSKSPPSTRHYFRKSDHTKEFSKKFQSLIRGSPKAAGQWRRFKGQLKQGCPIRKCIRMKLAFCEKYGCEFSALWENQCFSGLGSRSACSCSGTIQALNHMVMWHDCNNSPKHC